MKGTPKVPPGTAAKSAGTAVVGRPFVKGVSGNPTGRPKVVAEVRDLARQHTPEVIKRLLEISKSADSDSASVAACKELLDRAWGKAPQELKADISLNSLTDEQLEAKLKAISASWMGA